MSEDGKDVEPPVAYDKINPKYPWIAPATECPLTKVFGVIKRHDRHILERAKEKIRTDLDEEEWIKFRHYANPAAVSLGDTLGHIDKINLKDVSPEEFRERFERPNLPCVIDGIVSEWKASTEWTFESLFATYRHRRMKCGEDDDGYAVKIKLKYFLRYMAVQLDDSPMYVFDSAFDEDDLAKSLLEHYSVPSYFTDDLFKLVGEDDRPPYRWFLIGPKRSGTAPHIDPLATSAWNALISGAKRWVLFPPDCDKELVKGKALLKPGEDDEPVDWFLNVLPRIKATGIPGIIEFVQRPGETCFIPGGWWHAVLNIEDSVAVTQNFCSQVNFPAVWRSTFRGRPRMARGWREKLKTEYPHLYTQSKELDAADGRDLDEFIAFKQRRRAEKRERRKAAKEARKRAKAAKRAESVEGGAGAGAGAGSGATGDGSDDATSCDSSSSTTSKGSDSDTTDSDASTY